MKKLFIIIFLLFSTNIFAQKYLITGSGYMFPINDPTAYQYYNGAPWSSAYIAKQTPLLPKYSFAKGACYQIGFGYKFKKYFAVELNVNTVMGNSYTTNFNYAVKFDSSTNYYSGTWKTNVPKSTYFSSSIVFNPYPDKKFSPYCKLGITMVQNAKQYNAITTNITFDTFQMQTYIEDERTYYNTIGYTTTLGLNIKLKKKLHLGIEYNIQFMKPYLAHAKITKYYENGQDKWNELAPFISMHEINFVKNPLAFHSESPGAQPSYATMYTNNFSCMGIMFNLKYYFNK